MIILLDKDNKDAFLYQQIYKIIKQKILKRKIKSHEKLLSKRELANQLEVSVNTVTNAYEQLLAEGYIYSVERSGYFVENITKFSYQMKKPKRRIPDDLKESVEKREDWISLSHMTADVSLFPFKKWVNCQQQAIANHKNELSEIGHPQGPYIVRETISKMITLSRGVVAEPEQIVLSAGTQPLIQQLMAIQSKNTNVALEDPGYSRFYTLLKRMNIHVQPIQLDNKGISIKEVEGSKANLLFVTPSHQFPTGKIMPISRRIELLNWSTKLSNRFIVEDDYDSEFKYKTDNIPSLQMLDRNDRVIYMGTFSKSLLPSFRISYMVLPPKILREYRKHYADLIQYSNKIALYTLHYFIKSGAYNRHIKRMNHHYQIKRNLLIKQLSNRFQDKIIIKDIQAGVHFVCQFKTMRTYDEIEERLKQRKLEVYTMRRFMLENKYKEKNKIELIIGFASIKTDKIQEAVERLYHVIG